MDIIILLVCTFLIVNRLFKILGQYDADQSSARQSRNNSVILNLLKQKYDVEPKTINAHTISLAELQLAPEIISVLDSIRQQDSEFDFDRFMTGAKKAYSMYMQALNNRDLNTLKHLLESDLYQKIKLDIEQKSDVIKNVTINKIESIDLIKAAVYGDRAILTAQITYEASSLIQDSNGNLISAFQQPLQKKNKIEFSRYITQEKVWYISKVQE